MKRKGNTVFIVELFIMFIILLIVIVSIVTISMKTRNQSEQAGQLTQAVVCAENIAEVTKGARNANQAAGMIKKIDGAEKVKVMGDKTSIQIGLKSNGRYDEGDKDRVYDVTVKTETESGSSGIYIKENIAVFVPGEKEAVYVLDSGSYVKEEK